MPSKDSGRMPTKVKNQLRREILAGRVPPGGLLPGLRQLSREQGAALTTVHSALRGLVAEGLIAAEPRRGYRVLYGAVEDERHRPVAFVSGQPGSPAGWEPFSQELLVAFQAAAQSRGWTVLGAGVADQDPGAVLCQLSGARAWGALLDRATPALAERIRESGLPAISISAQADCPGLDVIVQDDYQAGMIAAEHLVSRGHRRIAWIGPTTFTGHSLARLAGASAALLRAGLEMPADLRVETNDATVRPRTIELLSRPDRPRALLVLWRDVAVNVAAAARELGLAPGRDFEMVGLCVEEQYERDFRPAFAGAVPATVTWSARTMANLAISRLAERRSHPEMEVVRIQLPVRIRSGEEGR
ncbi:MAG TPA: GntR family transcriptional regulator [Planctomycetota bacterium]|nr:GntR family transcriptional regulator [Planctomycetota bacterium]